MLAALRRSQRDLNQVQAQTTSWSLFSPTKNRKNRRAWQPWSGSQASRQVCSVLLSSVLFRSLCTCKVKQEMGCVQKAVYPATDNIKETKHTLQTHCQQGSKTDRPIPSWEQSAKQVNSVLWIKSSNHPLWATALSLTSMGGLTLNTKTVLTFFTFCSLHFRGAMNARP